MFITEVTDSVKKPEYYRHHTSRLYGSTVELQEFKLYRYTLDNGYSVVHRGTVF